MAIQRLDQLDRQILRMISEDARVPFLEVARACNVSGAAIHQRIQKLTNMGIIKGSQFIIDPEKIGYETCAYIGLNLKNPEDFDKVVEALQHIPEVTECHYTTGNFDMFIKIYALNNHHHPRPAATPRPQQFADAHLLPLGLRPAAAHRCPAHRGW